MRLAWALRPARCLGVALLMVVCGAPVLAAASKAALPAKPVPAEHDVHHHEVGSTVEALAERQRWLQEGERRLRVGDAEGARQAFEQAALQAHEGRIELGILRAQMQAGDYRHALAFAAHTAGVHLDDVRGRVFYAWLLNLGAQAAVAEQTLAPALAVTPDHPLVAAVQRHVRTGENRPEGPLLTEPARLAPWSVGASVEPGAQVVASACLLADGRHALVPASALPERGLIWLRNGLGQTVAAEPDPRVPPGLGLALLSLSSPLPVPDAMAVPPGDAFPGAPAFALNYMPDPAGEPAWPLMRLGFLGAPAAAAQQALTRRLGIDLPGPGPRGGPVVDQGGRLVGLALRRADGADLLIPIGALRAHFGEHFGAVAHSARPSPLATDELYERAMKTSLQLLVQGP